MQFRQWATQTLKQHLVDGYTLNQKRLQERGIEFEQVVSLLSQTLANQSLVNPDGAAVVAVIHDYARSWSLLQGYDEQSLGDTTAKQRDMIALDFDMALTAIGELKQAFLAKPVEQLINDNTLVALALLVAKSKLDQKELMIRLVEHFILLKEER